MRYADAVTAKRVDAPAKADPFTLESLITWLEKQNAADEYDPRKPEICLIGQWLRATGMHESCIPYESLRIGMIFSFQKIAISSRSTFGAALTRARALAQGQRE